MIDFFIKIVKELVPILISPMVVGFVLWKIGDTSEKKKLKADAIRELMGYRGDYGSTEFGRALNKVSVVFNDDDDIRLEVRTLYERINTSPNSSMTKRSIVGLIYKLCQKNGFKGLTEYDIDQAFPENKQEPQVSIGTEEIDNQHITKKKELQKNEVTIAANESEDK